MACAPDREPRMNLEGLTAFLAVAETGSFTGAAERLFLTQPAVSKRIALLEGDLDTRLSASVNAVDVWLKTLP